MGYINADKLDIKVDTQGERLYFVTRRWEDAELQYRLRSQEGRKVIDFTHIFVPEAIRNMGIGSRLTNEGLQFAKANNYRVEASCSFVTHYLDHHPEYRNMRIRS